MKYSGVGLGGQLHGAGQEVKVRRLHMKPRQPRGEVRLEQDGVDELPEPRKT